MTRISAFVATSCLLVVFSACTSGSGDESRDAGRDTGAAVDAGTDAAGDAGKDSGLSAYEIDPQRIYDDIAVLASAEYGGRSPGTPGGDLTIAFVEKRFQDLGLFTPVAGTSYLQPFQFNQWTQTDLSNLTIGGESLVEGTDYITFQYSGAVSVTAELVFAGYGMTVPEFSKTDYPDCPLDPTGYDDYAGIDVTGKIVIILRRAPQDNAAIYQSCPANPEASTSPTDTLARFDYKAKNAKVHGAKAMILVQNYLSTPEYLDGAGLGATSDPDFAAVFANRDKIQSHVADLQTWAQAIDSTLKPQSRPTGVIASVEVHAEFVPVNTSNVIGVVQGTDPALKDEVIVVGAHMDHLGTLPNGDINYGADDNASGTATMMELARAAVKSGLKPARTIVFAAWNAEEEGLIGSCYYVNTSPLYPIANVKAMFSVDMVGVGNGTGLDLFGATDADKAWIATLMANAGTAKGLGYTVEPAAPYDASDHVCFSYAGVPAVLALSLAEADHLYYHTPQDTIDTISMDTLKASAELLWAALEPLALGVESDYLGQKSSLCPADPVTTRTFLRRLERHR